MSRVGSDVLLVVEGEVVGSQRDVTFTENTAAIDVSSKEERAQRVLAGRYSSEITLDALYVYDDDGYEALRLAMRNGDLVEVIRREPAGEAGDSTADALVTSISDRFPDAAESTISVSLTIDGEWS